MHPANRESNASRLGAGGPGAAWETTEIPHQQGHGLGTVISCEERTSVAWDQSETQKTNAFPSVNFHVVRKYEKGSLGDVPSTGQRHSLYTTAQDSRWPKENHFPRDNRQVIEERGTSDHRLPTSTREGTESPGSQEQGGCGGVHKAGVSDMVRQCGWPGSREVSRRHPCSTALLEGEVRHFVLWCLLCLAVGSITAEDRCPWQSCLP